MLKMYVVFVFSFTRVMKRILIGFDVPVVDGCTKIALTQRILYMTSMVENYSALTVLCNIIDFITNVLIDFKHAFVLKIVISYRTHLML